MGDIGIGTPVVPTPQSAMGPRHIAILTWVCLAVAPSAGAQRVMAVVEGTVRNAAGAGLPNVTVTALNTDTGSVQSFNVAAAFDVPR